MKTVVDNIERDIDYNISSSINSLDSGISSSISSLDSKVEDVKEMFYNIEYDVRNIKDAVDNRGNDF